MVCSSFSRKTNHCGIVKIRQIRYLVVHLTMECVILTIYWLQQCHHSPDLMHPPCRMLTISLPFPLKSKRTHAKKKQSLNGFFFFLAKFDICHSVISNQHTHFQQLICFLTCFHYYYLFFFFNSKFYSNYYHDQVFFSLANITLQTQIKKLRPYKSLRMSYIVN